MNEEEKIEISLNEEDVQNIINCYEKDIEYIKQLEQENQQLNQLLKDKGFIIDKLMEENRQLKEELEKIKQPTIFIDTQDMEERYGEQLYQDYLVEQNKDLQQRIDKMVKISLQLRTHLANWLFKEGYMGGERTKKFLDELDEILKGSDNNV